ncbi:MAG: amidohydrolase [Acidobacteria bacterium]|nr:amidohydrolase [Acidobacteriota bacterium]
MMANRVEADLILRNGKIITVDSAFRIAQAVAVRGERIAAVGDNDSIGRLAGADTRIIDLSGRAVMPGLIDCHAHMDREGLKAVWPALDGARSIDDVLARIEALVGKAGPGEWIVTMPLGDPPYYWDVPDTLREKRFPTRWDLDRVAPDNPVYIRSIWGFWRHTLPLVSIANSAALQAAGITRQTVPPCDTVKIERDSGGEPTGVFLEWSYMPVVELSLMAAAPRFTHAHRVEGLRRSMQVYNAAGTTSIYEEHGIAGEVLAAYQELADGGELTVRSHLAFSPSWSSAEAPARELLQSWARWLAGRGLGDAILRMEGLYAEIDTSVENSIRARQRPYTGWAGFYYDSALPREAVREVVLEAARCNIRVCGCWTDLLDLYEEVDRVVPIGDRRWVLGHINVLTGEQIRKIRDLGLALTTHTNRYVFKEGELLRKRVGPGAENTVVPLRSLLDAGVHVALATDNVPPSLFHPVWHCIARIDHHSGKVIAPEQRLTRQEALRAATIEGAWVTFDEARKGSIEPGKLADLVILSADPLRVEEPEIKNIVAETTLVGGRIVFQREPG